ncbi:ADP-ribosylation factor-like protein 2 isoform 1-T1 [Liasis olivaceus]
MGLLSILKKMRQKERELRLLMLGLDNAGKTTILKKFNGDEIDTISPTLGFNIKTLEHRGFKLNIWDVGGQKSLRSYWRNYFESTDGLIWVVDSADHQRLDDCRRELQTLLVEERLAGATLLIFWPRFTNTDLETVFCPMLKGPSLTLDPGPNEATSSVKISVRISIRHGPWHWSCCRGRGESHGPLPRLASPRGIVFKAD